MATSLITSTVKPTAETLTLVMDILRQRFGERLSISRVVCEQHGHTTTWIPNQPPDMVVFAENTDEVSEVVRIAGDHRVPIIPFGIGSSLEGHLNAPAGGISIDLSKMDQILSVSPENMDCRVQPGVTRKALNAYLRDTGLFFPVDPGANASIGGMVATGASGTNAVRYGTMRDMVNGLTVVLADGSVVTTGTRARKSSAGYDLTRLMIGSEGTLGVITEIGLRLSGVPEQISGGVCPFPDVRAACDAVIATIQCGIPVARIELLDELQMQASIAYSKLDYPVSVALFLEFHGSEAGVAEQSAQFAEIADAYGGGEFQWTVQTEERNRLWAARHDAYWAARGLRPGAEAVATDVCVPISRLADCVVDTKSEIAERGLLGPIVGHVGDGNFHVTLLIDLDNEEELRNAREVVHNLNRRAIAMGGTCTGEHGVGQGKMQYMNEEHGAALDVMRSIKSALDPKGILNPGKIVAV